jgi:predicted XRE-type DNA-binding protein
LTRAKAAKLLDIDQSEMAALLNGQLSDISVDHLLRFLTALGDDVEIVVKESSSERERGRLSVVCG